MHVCQVCGCACNCCGDVEDTDTGERFAAVCECGHGEGSDDADHNQGFSPC